MSEQKEMVTITQEEFEELIKARDWLTCLESAGVDNWGGIDFAQELYQQNFSDDEDENE